MPTLIDLGKKIRKKYPGEFDDLDDLELGRQIKAANPGKYDKYEESYSQSRKATPYSPVSQGLELSGKILGASGSGTAKNIWANIAKLLPISKESKENITEKQKGKEQIFAGDILEEVAPFMKEPEQDVATGYRDRITSQLLNLGVGTSDAAITGESSTGDLLSQVKDIYQSATNPPKVNPLSVLAMFGRTTGRFGADIFGDPLTWARGPSVTKLGKLRGTVQEAGIRGEKIKLKGKLGQQIAKELGVKTLTPKLVKDFKKNKPQEGFAKQVGAGEASLASLGPLELKGPLVGKAIEPIAALAKNKYVQKVDNAVRLLFSTATGNKDYDMLTHKYRSLVLHKTGVVLEEASVLNKAYDDISRETGKPREEIQREVNAIAERIVPKTKAEHEIAYGTTIANKLGFPQDARVYGKIMREALEESYHERMVDHQVALAKAQKVGDQKAIAHHSSQVAEYNALKNEISGKYSPPPNVDPKIAQLAREYKTAANNQLMAEQASGLPAKPLLADRSYITHALLPKTLESLKAKAIAEGKLPTKVSQKEFSDWVQNYLERQFNEVRPKVIQGWKDVGIITPREYKTIMGKRGIEKLGKMLDDGDITQSQYTDAVHTLGLDEIHALPRKELEAVFGKDIGDKVYHEDPVFYSSIRNIRGQRAITASEFYKDMIKRGLAVPKGTIPGWIPAKPSELKGYEVEPRVARHLNSFHDFSTNPNEFKEFMHMYDRVHSLMKGWTLAIFPSHHTKNMVGNFFNNWLAGVNNPQRYFDAEKVLLGKDYNISDIFGNVYSSAELREAASKLGVLHHGQYAGEGVQQYRVISQQLESGKWLTGSSRNKILRFGRKVGAHIEDNARVAHFIDRIKKGDTLEQAAMSVKEHLFDYTDLTPFERQIMNRTFFFYKWTKENLPLQLHYLVRTPWKYGAPFKLKHEIEKTSPQPDEHYMSEFMKENFPTRIRYDAKNKRYEYFLMKSWLPAADLLNLFHMHEVVAQSLAPIPKEVLQQRWNYDFYFKNKIEKFTGEKKEFNLPGLGKRNLPSRQVHALKLIRLLNEYDRMTKEDSDLYTKLMELFTGQAYPYTPEEAVGFNMYRVRDDMRTLRSGIIKESQKEVLDQKEVERIIKMMEKKSEEY